MNWHKLKLIIIVQKLDLTLISNYVVDSNLFREIYQKNFNLYNQKLKSLNINCENLEIYSSNILNNFLVNKQIIQVVKLKI
jgi:hypothetical protein